MGSARSWAMMMMMVVGEAVGEDGGWNFLAEKIFKNLFGRQKFQMCLCFIELMRDWDRNSINTIVELPKRMIEPKIEDE